MKPNRTRPRSIGSHWDEPPGWTRLMQHIYIYIYIYIYISNAGPWCDIFTAMFDVQNINGSSNMSIIFRQSLNNTLSEIDFSHCDWPQHSDVLWQTISYMDCNGFQYITPKLTSFKNMLNLEFLMINWNNFQGVKAVGDTVFIWSMIY